MGKYSKAIGALLGGLVGIAVAALGVDVSEGQQQQIVGALLAILGPVVGAWIAPANR